MLSGWWLRLILPQDDMGETAPSAPSVTMHLPASDPPGGPPQPGAGHQKGLPTALCLKESRVPPNSRSPPLLPPQQTDSDRQLWRDPWPGSRPRCFLLPSVCVGVLGSEGGGFLLVVMETAASLLSVWVLSSAEDRGAATLGGNCCHGLSAAPQWKGPEGLSCF